MAINVYCGLQGSGKSYEVVSTPVLDAVAAGRRVVTNIDGINEAAIHAYLAKRRQIPAERLGQIVAVANERVMAPGFFPNEDRPEVVSLVLPGDLIAIDEAWRFWPSSAKVSLEHMQFFTMHRHYVHPETGGSCDLVLMTQDISGLCRPLRNVIELSFRMHKLKALGLAKTYRVELFEGWKQTRKMRIDVFTRRYQAEIFPLYKSYAGKDGNERTIDKRQNVLTNPKLWSVSALTIGVGLAGAWQTWRFFNPEVSEKPSAQAAVRDDPTSAAPRDQVTDIRSAALRVSPSDSSAWRVAGRFKADGIAWIALIDKSGRLRVESPSLFTNDGIAMIGVVEQQRVSTWSGEAATRHTPSGLQ